LPPKYDFFTSASNFGFQSSCGPHLRHHLHWVRDSSVARARRRSRKPARHSLSTNTNVSGAGKWFLLRPNGAGGTACKQGQHQPRTTSILAWRASPYPWNIRTPVSVGSLEINRPRALFCSFSPGATSQPRGSFGSFCPGLRHSLGATSQPRGSVGSFSPGVGLSMIARVHRWPCAWVPVGARGCPCAHHMPTQCAPPPKLVLAETCNRPPPKASWARTRERRQHRQRY
jgi:hypothetical protein